MKKLIKESEFMKLSNSDKCKLMILIIRGQAIYTKGG